MFEKFIFKVTYRANETLKPTLMICLGRRPYESLGID